MCLQLLYKQSQAFQNIKIWTNIQYMPTQWFGVGQLVAAFWLIMSQFPTFKTKVILQSSD